MLQKIYSGRLKDRACVHLVRKFRVIVQQLATGLVEVRLLVNII